jgi:hypothetical protein
VSKRRDLLKRVLTATGLLVVIGLGLGLLNPIAGAAAGFGVGIALTLNMPYIDGQLARRLIAVALAVAYMVILLLFIPPAGLLAGALLPGLAVGFADEYGTWRVARKPTE